MVDTSKMARRMIAREAFVIPVDHLGRKYMNLAGPFLYRP